MLCNFTFICMQKPYKFPLMIVFAIKIANTKLYPGAYHFNIKGPVNWAQPYLLATAK